MPYYNKKQQVIPSSPLPPCKTMENLIRGTRASGASATLFFANIVFLYVLVQADSHLVNLFHRIFIKG